MECFQTGSYIKPCGLMFIDMEPEAVKERPRNADADQEVADKEDRFEEAMNFLEVVLNEEEEDDDEPSQSDRDEEEEDTEKGKDDGCGEESIEGEGDNEEGDNEEGDNEEGDNEEGDNEEGEKGEEERGEESSDEELFRSRKSSFARALTDSEMSEASDDGEDIDQDFLTITDSEGRKHVATSNRGIGKPDTILNTTKLKLFARYCDSQTHKIYFFHH